MQCDIVNRQCCSKWSVCLTKLKLNRADLKAICCPDCDEYISYGCSDLRETVNNGLIKISELLYQKINSPKDFKIIFFIGAGASASSGVSISKNTKQFFIDKFKRKNYGSLFRRSIENIKDYIDNKYGAIPEVRLKISQVLSEISTIDKLADENVTMEIVLAIAQYLLDKEEVIKKLSKEFPDRNDPKMPSMGYEILAHLAKHGFIDAFVSMNYDEFLEKSLADEIGEDDIFQIVSDEDFEKAHYLEKKGLLEEKIKIFKPHGTISSQHLMKFDIQDVVALSETKYKYLKNLLDDNDTRLIFLGYRNNDIDMKRLLEDVAFTKGINNNNTIFWIYRASLTTNPYSSGIYEVLSKSRSLENQIIFPPDSSVFDDFLIKLVEAINSKIHQRDSISNLLLLTRHKIRRLLFGKNILEESFKNKFILEVLIYALKAQGAFYQGSLLDCQRLKNYSKKLENESTNVKPLLDVLKKGILKEFRSNLLVLKPHNLDDLTNNLKEIFGSHFLLNQADKDEFKTLLLELIKRFDIDINTKSRMIYLLFNDAKPIKNYLDLINETRNIIRDESLKNDGDIRIVTETGDWLLEDGIRQILEEFQNKQGVKILISDRNIKESTLFDSAKIWYIEAELKNLNIINIRCLPSEEHDAHMTIGSNKAVYFIRRERSATISPGLIANKSDINMLKSKFDDIWHNALSIELKNFWSPFIQEGGTITVGTEGADLYGLEKSLLGKRELISTKDFRGAYSILTFLSRLTYEKIKQQFIYTYEPTSLQLDQNQNYIIIGGSDYNLLTGKAWGLLKARTEDWNNKEVIQRGFVFRKGIYGDEKDNSKNIFIERTTIGDIGIRDYEEQAFEFYEYNDTNNWSLVIKAKHPFNTNKTLLIIAGFDGFATENSAYFLISNQFQGEIEKINHIYNKYGNVEALLKINMKSITQEITVEKARPIVQI